MTRRSAASACANGLWAASAMPAWARYRRWLRDPARQQAARLARYLDDNRDTAFGRQHRFDRIDSVRAYQERVPIRTYDELSPFIDRIAAGERAVLTSDPVRRFAFTSGSTAGAKLVPYTRTLTQELTRGVAVWMADLFLRDPQLAGGPAYWSITPIGRREPNVHTRVPIGFDDDTEYLGPVARRLAAATLAVPSIVREIDSIETCRYVTLLFLLRARALRLVSVWHPSFFTLLLDALDAWWPRLLDDLARGTVTLTGCETMPASVAQRLQAHLAPDPRRAEALAAADTGPSRSAATGTGTRTAARDLRAIWPELRLISCWTDGPAQWHLAELARRAGHVRVQGKGLVATEAFVTMPFSGEPFSRMPLGGGPLAAGRHVDAPFAEARPLALPCHFFELIDDRGRARLAHEVETDGEYSIVVTTGGGLYRYRLQDRVRVTGWVGRTPSLTFIGKEDAISDVVGEKLSEGFVTQVLRDLFAAHGLTPRFALLAPEQGRATGGSGSYDTAYTLFLDARVGRETSVARSYGLDSTFDTTPDLALDARLGTALEAALRANPHYAYAVDLGQLAPARVVSVGPGAQEAYLARRTRDGLRLGDIKPAALSPQRGWSSVLPGLVPAPDLS